MGWQTVDKKRGYLACFGHPLFLHAVAHAVAIAAGMRARELDTSILDLHLGESEGLLVPLYAQGKSALLLKLPP